MTGQTSPSGDPRQRCASYDGHAELGDERGLDGEPPSLDFELYELPRILHGSPPGGRPCPSVSPGNPRYRVLIADGAIVYACAVTGVVQRDGSISLVTLRLAVRRPLAAPRPMTMTMRTSSTPPGPRAESQSSVLGRRAVVVPAAKIALV